MKSRSSTVHCYLLLCENLNSLQFSYSVFLAKQKCVDPFVKILSCTISDATALSPESWSDTVGSKMSPKNPTMYHLMPLLFILLPRRVKCHQRTLPCTTYCYLYSFFYHGHPLTLVYTGSSVSLNFKMVPKDKVKVNQVKGSAFITQKTDLVQ